MSKSQSLRDLVNARLTAAAEEIFEVFVKTIAEYEEELGRSKKENERKQRLLDTILSPRINLMRVRAHSPSLCPPGPSLTQETTQTSQIKDEPKEQSIKQEQQPLTISTAVCTRRKESSPPQQRQTELQEEIKQVDISSESDIQTENSSDMDDDEDDWGRPLSSAECSEAETDGDQSKQIKIRRNGSASKISALENNGGTLDTKKKAKRQKHQCPVCERRFQYKKQLVAHSRRHRTTGERSFSCSICNKTFKSKHYLEIHQRVHAKEKPYRCTVCKEAFTEKHSLLLHSRKHIGIALPILE